MSKKESDIRYMQYFTRISLKEHELIYAAAAKAKVKPAVFGRETILKEARRVMGQPSA